MERNDLIGSQLRLPARRFWLQLTSSPSKPSLGWSSTTTLTGLQVKRGTLQLARAATQQQRLLSSSSSTTFRLAGTISPATATVTTALMAGSTPAPSTQLTSRRRPSAPKPACFIQTRPSAVGSKELELAAHLAPLRSLLAPGRHRLRRQNRAGYCITLCRSRVQSPSTPPSGAPNLEADFFLSCSPTVSSHRSVGRHQGLRRSSLAQCPPATVAWCPSG